MIVKGKIDWNTDKMPVLAGPWDDEPDVAAWQRYGVECRIHRNSMGALCGYVGVEARHPWYRKGYDRVTKEVTIHGGLTFSDFKADEAGALWWMGFDTSHAGDLVPGLDAVRRMMHHAERGDTYRTFAYVRKEVERLARQAVDAATKGKGT